MSTRAIREALAELKGRREDGGSSDGTAVMALAEVEAIEALVRSIREECDGADREIQRTTATDHGAYWHGRRVTAALLLARLEGVPKT